MKLVYILLTLFTLQLAALHSPLSGSEPGEQRQNSGKRNLTFGFLPALAFSADKGFGYGIVLQADDKRAGGYSPYYASHRLILKRTTKGIGDYSYRFDSKYIFRKKIRITMKASYLTSILEPFYGFGGAQTLYNESYKDSSDPEKYRGKFYYEYDKRYYRVDTIFQGALNRENLRWLGGFTILSTEIDTIDYNDFDEKYLSLPTNTLLAKLIRSGVVDKKSIPGGSEHSFLVGLVWDSRDDESTPNSGVWSEALFRWVPDMLGNDFSYLSLTGTHRQYLPLIDKLTFAYRLSGRFMSEGVPFFTATQLDGSFQVQTGIGGGKTIRGVVYQRVNSRNNFYGNFELRYKIADVFTTGYAAVSSFYDLGRSFDTASMLAEEDIGSVDDKFHQGIGAGIRLAINSTFIVAVDIGKAVDPSIDGGGLKLYIGLDWLY